MSSKITVEQVQHIANLAYIGLSEEEKEKLQNDLGTILDYVDKLQNVDTDEVGEAVHITGLENEMREDENGSNHSDPGTLASMVPETKDGYVKVRQVLMK